MNHPDAFGKRPQTRRGPNFFLLLVMAMMAFFLYSQYQRSRQQAASPELPPPNSPNIEIPDISNDGKPSGEQIPNGTIGQRPGPPSGNPHGSNAGGDWAIDTDIPSRARETQTEIALPTDRAGRSGDTVRSGDWSIEEGRSRSSNPSVKLKPSALKTTRDGDWSLGEVETTPK